MTWIETAVDAWNSTVFSTATWIDAIDVLLLSAVIYRLLVMLKGTRAMQSMFGLFLLGVVYRVSDLLGLATVHWVLDNLVVYAVLALIILFQDDIRRVLARAGDGLALGPQGSSDVAWIEPVVQASFALAGRRLGALVVVEREGSLAGFLEGTPVLDATPSSDLLQAIFHPTSPLHDGAVVVRQRRLANAAVFLPINLSRDVGRALGTRHRAAIGLTEDSDAVAVVVSEERGTVSLATHGQIRPMADVGELRTALIELFSQRAPAPAEAA